MPYIKLEPSTKFGKLTVISRGQTQRCGHITWRCRCECGRVKDFNSQALRTSRIKSCGAGEHRKGHSGYNRLKPGESSFNTFLRNLRFSASSRNLTLNLDKEIVRTLVLAPCHYCRRIKVQSTRATHSREAFQHNGIDRVDNTKGYVLENVVTCCIDCNRAKGTLTVAQFITWVNAVYARHIKRS